MLLINANLKEAQRIERDNRESLDELSSEADAILEELGIDGNSIRAKAESEPQNEVEIRQWGEIIEEASSMTFNENDVLAFQQECLRIEGIANGEISAIRREYEREHKLDALDWAIASIAGTLAGIVDVLLVGMPKHGGFLGSKASKGGVLSNYMKSLKGTLNGKYSKQLHALENKYKVPYDASTNRNLKNPVSGLGPTTHRFQSLGHDASLLGFAIGVYNIMTGKMTAIDKTGNVITQVVSGSNVSAGNFGMRLFEAIAHEFFHLLSDVSTSQGLPVPGMPFLQLLQFGKIGSKGQYTIGQVSRMMYRAGYDFSHYVAMGVCPLIISAIVRIAYFAKQMGSGHSLKDSIPFDLPQQKEKKPKLQTMLFAAHSVAAAVNVGKIAITKNPLAINVPELTIWAKSAFHQAKWMLWEKEEERLNRIQCVIDQDWNQLDEDLVKCWQFV